MNEQLLLRTTDMKEFEVLKFESTFFNTKKYQRKNLTINTLIKLLQNLITSFHEEKITLHHNNIFETDSKNVVAYTKTNKEVIYILRIKERYIRTFYNENYYKIIHPNCFIKVIVAHGLVQQMYIYPYKEYKGLDTILFDNPFPNILTKNETCMGTSDKTVKETKTKTVLSIIETAYTHAYTNFKSNKLKDTTEAFNYLSKNEFPYEDLVSTGLILKNLIQMCKMGN